VVPFIVTTRCTEENDLMKRQYRLDVSTLKLTPGAGDPVWSMVCTYSRAKGRKGVTMDFAIILIVSNTLLAGFIYFVVTRIWQD
jgi:hypothetical protein